jgi:hypothetical protein
MRVTEHLKVSARGFSPKRTAYLLDGVALLLTVFFQSYIASAYYQVRSLTQLAMICLFVIVAILCLCSPRSVDRWLPLFICGGICFCYK